MMKVMPIKNSVESLLSYIVILLCYRLNCVLYQ